MTTLLGTPQGAEWLVIGATVLIPTLLLILIVVLVVRRGGSA